MLDALTTGTGVYRQQITDGDVCKAFGDPVRVAFGQYLSKSQDAQYDKTEMNSFVQNLYNKKMQEGKHGHYETMFHVVHKAIERAHGIREVK